MVPRCVLCSKAWFASGGFLCGAEIGEKPPVGWIIVTVGIIVLLSQILPAGFWWFLLGACLIGVGICINRNCC